MDSPITTSETLPTYQLAPRWRRLLADFIDVLPLILLFWFPIVDVLLAVYYLTRDALPMLGGQSLGKKLLGIRVLKQDSLETTRGEFGIVFLRTFPAILPILNIVDAIYIFSKSRQRIGDRWAKTIVVLS